MKGCGGPSEIEQVFIEYWLALFVQQLVLFVQEVQAVFGEIILSEFRFHKNWCCNLVLQYRRIIVKSLLQNWFSIWRLEIGKNRVCHVTKPQNMILKTCRFFGRGHSWSFWTFPFFLIVGKKGLTDRPKGWGQTRNSPGSLT